MNKSFVLTSALPTAVRDIELFENAVSLLKSKGVSTVEFFAEQNMTVPINHVLKKYEMKGIFLAAAHQKKNKLSLCSVNVRDRETALEETRMCINRAISCGADRVLITSGWYQSKENEPAEWEALRKSIISLCQDFPNIIITLEPGDRSIDAMQLSGGTVETIKWMETFDLQVSNFELTMDTSHLAQLDEDPISSIILAKKHCRHIHLANCVLKQGHELFGDKHPFFAHPDGVYTIDRLKEILQKLSDEYDSKTLFSIEVINRGENEWDTFNRIIAEEDWFFNIDSVKD